MGYYSRYSLEVEEVKELIQKLFFKWQVQSN
jgi:hypothetical protein